MTVYWWLCIVGVRLRRVLYRCIGWSQGHSLSDHTMERQHLREFDINNIQTIMIDPDHNMMPTNLVHSYQYSSAYQKQLKIWIESNRSPHCHVILVASITVAFTPCHENACATLCRIYWWTAPGWCYLLDHVVYLKAEFPLHIVPSNKNCKLNTCCVWYICAWADRVLQVLMSRCTTQVQILTLKGPIPYIYGTQVWLSLCLQMS